MCIRPCARFEHALKDKWLLIACVLGHLWY